MAGLKREELFLVSHASRRLLVQSRTQLQFSYMNNSAILLGEIVHVKEKAAEMTRAD